jgi:glycosyltransferase involved in cell wall biosynthesis
MRILLIAGLADSLVNFRGPLIQALLSHELEVHVAAPDFMQSEGTRQRLQGWGVVVHDAAMNRTGKNPFSDLRTVWVLWRLMRQIKPDAVLGYTIKPVIFGSFAAWLAAVPRRFALVTGLGYAFQGERRGMLMLVQRLYAWALARVHLVFFQNPDDLALFRDRGILSSGTVARVVNGSGVDVSYFSPTPLPKDGLCFLLIARLLGDKGVREYVEAARQVKQRWPDVQFAMVGWIDSNPDSIGQQELDAWVAEGLVNYWGRMTDVRSAISQASVYVLPSYREGTPRTVLEAMAMGRAAITTDAPGCRETVVDGDNGLLVPVKSANELAQAMLRFVDDASLASRMGKRAREVAVEKYDVHKVNAVMLKEMGIS